MAKLYAERGPMRLIRDHVFLPCFAALALFSGTTDALGQSDSPITAETISISMERDFIAGPFGQVHVRIARPATKTQKPPLVLFHPTPYSSDYFVKFMQLMAADRVVIAIDTPGYGDSDRPKELQSIEGYAGSAAAVLTAMGYGNKQKQPVDILGYHTGTLIATELAIRHPDLVRRLVLPGLPFFTGEKRKEAYKANAKPEPVTSDGSHLNKKWEFATAATDVGMPLERAQAHFNDLMQCYPHCWEAYHGVFTYPSENRFPAVQQPVLLVTNDGSLKQETGAALPLFPDAQLMHISGVTLGGFDLAPEKYIALIRPFLDGELDKKMHSGREISDGRK
ncbi:alpha/beta fold hydrolase [Parasphingorhabdus cellanae]|uniref:Alpha/beta hydrolase n=1 Tax=Parasphingorhabdus cellanae TaxID=2806553 RepID=A0ABX7T4J0_9SPHN|nr:alpha/beta hydrolase [Parasphingorhabdus cellanae]QTD55170.1 alpha/beta hydrolase [Parasphingorhabdus cellanae]